MAIDRILIHGCFPNHSGYASHTRNFATELNKLIPVRVRNYAYQKDLSHLTQEQKDMVILQNNGDMVLGKPYDGDIMGDDHTLNIILLEHNHFWYYQDYHGPTIGYCVWESTKMKKEFFNRLLQLDGIFAPTNWQRKCMIEQGYSEDKIWVVPEGVDGSIFKPGKEHNGKFRFLMFGRYDYRKSNTENIRAFLDADLDAELILSADNPYPVDSYKTTEERLKGYGLEDDRIKILHFPPTKEYVEYLQGGNVFLGISRAEGWHLPAIEAIACGIPAILSKHGGQLDYAYSIARFVNTKEDLLLKNVFNTKDSDLAELGTWVEPDWNHAVKVIKNTYNNYTKYKEVAVNYSKVIRERFSWSNAANKAYSIIRNIDTGRQKHSTSRRYLEEVGIELYQDQLANDKAIKADFTVNVLLKENKVEFIYNGIDAVFRTIIFDLDTNLPVYSYRWELVSNNKYWMCPVVKLENLSGIRFCVYTFNNKEVLDDGVLIYKYEERFQRIEKDNLEIAKRIKTNICDGTYSVYKEIILDDAYVYPECSVEEGDVVLDAGANVGIFTLYALDKGASKVHCYEPVRETYGYLSETLKGFENVELFNLAISDNKGTDTISKHLSPDTCSIRSGGASMFKHHENGIEEKVNCVTLDEAINKIGYVNFLKIDIEGKEGAIFTSLKDGALKNVDKIAMEIHNNQPLDKIKKVLELEGFNDLRYVNQSRLLFAKKGVFKKIEGMELYQDQWLNGRCVKEGVVDCDSRYEALKKVFSQYNRPFTILDVGANFGYYSIRAAEDFDATCVLVESEDAETEQLLELISKSKKKDNFTVLKRRIKLDELMELSTCEHFDVVLALNVIHHYPNNITNVCDAFMKLGDNLIAETPPIKDEGACGRNNLQVVIDYFNKQDTTKLGSFKRHTSNREADMIWTKTTKKELTHTYYGWDNLLNVVDPKLHHLLKKQPLQIHSTWDKKTLYNNRRGVVADWIDGINFKTFVVLDGIYPERKNIISDINNRKITTDYKFDDTATDLVLHNFILKGTKLHLIDYYDEHTDETTNKKDDECIEGIINGIKGNVVEPEPENLVKLNVACGNDLKPGWINVDRYNGNADEKWDVLDLKMEDRSVDKIFASHILEHFSVRDVPVALTEWNRVLKVGGKIIIAVPNIEKAIKDWSNSKDKWVSLTNELFGGQDHLGNFHQCGFTKDILNKIVKSYGFEIDYCEADPINSNHLLCRATKVDGVKYDNILVDNYYINGAYTKINGEGDKYYSVTFKDGDGNHIHSTILGAGWFTRTNRKYYTDWETEVSVGKKILYNNKINLEGKRVLIELNSKSLGDTLCWAPYVEEFRKKHKCEVFCMTFWNNILDYPDIHFIEPGDNYENIHASYSIGCFDGNTDRNKNHWKTIPLQQIATDYLGLEYQEIRPKLKNIIGKTDMKIKLPKKYVVIAPHSTAQMKYWLDDRWNKVIEYLHKIGYETIALSKEPNRLANTIYTTNPSIEDAIRIIKKSKFTMTVGNGIAWISFALSKPNILISGFSDYCEFEEGCYRIVPETGCKACFNNPNIPFVRDQWDYCWNFEHGGKKFECAQNISVKMVLKVVEKLRSENNV